MELQATYDVALLKKLAPEMEHANDDLALREDLASVLPLPHFLDDYDFLRNIDADPLLSGPNLWQGQQEMPVFSGSNLMWQGQQEMPHLHTIEPNKQECGRNSKRVKSGNKWEGKDRTAFVVESAVEELNDGFKWRKYGDKAVKRSPYRRKYYRCSNANCSVKKHVERAANHPQLVIVTYEGQHNHHDHVLVNGVEKAWIVHNPFVSNMDSIAHTDFSLSQNPYLASLNMENIAFNTLVQDCMNIPPSNPRP